MKKGIMLLSAFIGVVAVLISCNRKNKSEFHQLDVKVMDELKPDHLK